MYNRSINLAMSNSFAAISPDIPLPSSMEVGNESPEGIGASQ